jgi:hypothetical protein
MNPEKKSLPTWLIIVIPILGLLCCCCVGIFIFTIINANFSDSLEIFGEDLEIFEAVESTFPQDDSGILVEQPKNPFQSTLNSISEAQIPPSDPADTAYRLGRILTINRAKTEPPAVFDLGDQAKFWVMNQDSIEVNEKNALLRMITPHAYIWIEEGSRYDQEALEDLANTFEEEIYPRTREIFGSEWNPGVDNDEHLFILYTDDMGEGIAGTFSSDDSIPQMVNSYSNEHEMFYISDTEDLSDPYTYGVLAHEFHHMILWNHDVNEDTWIAEGLADLAVYLNGYDQGGFDQLFAENPDIQLNTWPEDSVEQDAHYGSSFLFIAYLFSQFGEGLIREIMVAPENGWEGLDAVLASKRIPANDTSIPLKAEQVFGDWVVANFLNSPIKGNTRFSYQLDYPIPYFQETEISECPLEWEERTVNQFGADYIRMNCAKDLILEFQGESSARLIPDLDEGDNHFFWSNRADSSQTTLSQEFHFPDTEDPIWLNYRVWYNLEEGFDYAYLLAKIDGSPWKILNPSLCTSEDPVGANLGCGYTGSSGGWQDQTIDISAFAGKKVELQFTVITDSAVNLHGMLVDDITITGIGYNSNLENDTGGWESRGWALTQNTLPQSFEISVIREGKKPQVERYTLSNGENFNQQVRIKAGEPVVLAVSGTTRYITTPATYKFRFVEIP